MTISLQMDFFYRFVVARTRIVLAAFVAVVYLAVTVGNAILHISGNGSHLSLNINFNQLANWLIAIVSIMVAIGLCGRYAWAWWLGLAAGGFQLFRLVRRVLAQNSMAYLPSTHVFLLFGLLLIFLLLLISPKAMASCNR